MHRSTFFLTSALVGDEWSASHAPVAFRRGKSPMFPVDRRVGGPQSRSGRRGEKKILDPIGTRTPIPRSFSPQPVATLTTLSHRLCVPLILLCDGYRGPFTGVNLSGREADHSPPINAKVKKMFIYTSTPPTSSRNKGI
jgi:hypothetical protein